MTQGPSLKTHFIPNSDHMNISPKLIIVGRLPPPLGGVTVHLNRLAYYLNARNFPFHFFDLSGQSNPGRGIVGCGNLFILIWNLLTRPYKICHCHASNHWLFLLVDFIVARILRRKTIYTLHGEGVLLQCESGPDFLKSLLQGAFRRATRIIAINSRFEERALLFAAGRENVLNMPAYLPPTPEEVSSVSLLPDEFEQFFKEHGLCFASQGTFGNKYIGDDLYRFDLLGNVLSRLRILNPEVGLCSLVSQSLDAAAREKVFSLRRELGLDQHWLILENFGSAIPIYKRCIAFVRPTMSDGDSLSVRECIDFGIPVVASDAVPRPDGCILFHSGDIDSLETELNALLADYPTILRRVQQIKSPNCFEQLLACYNEVAP